MAETNVIQGEFGMLRRLASALMNRSSWARRAGISFDGKRDLWKVLGYPDEIQPKDYRAQFERGGIAARIVEVIAESTWRGGAEVVEDPDPQVETAFEKEFKALNKRLKILNAAMKADKLAGLGQYSGMLIGTTGAMESQVLRRTADEILYLKPYGQEELKLYDINVNTKDPRFGQPATYKFKLETPLQAGQNRATFERIVHWSRVIHVADNTLDDDTTGLPRLQRVWNLLMNLDKVTGGGSEAFWLRANQGTQFNLDKDVELSEENEKKLKDEIDEFANGIRRYVRTRGMEMETHGSDVADFAQPADAVLTQIAAAIGIPKRILLGSERGDLASSQDKGHWDDFVSDRRTRFAGPVVLETLINRFIEWGVLPEPKQYVVDWPQIKNLDEKGRADVANILSKVNKQAGGVVLLPEEIRDSVLLMPKLTDEQKKKFEEDQQAEFDRQLALKSAGKPEDRPAPERDREQ